MNTFNQFPYYSSIQVLYTLGVLVNTQKLIERQDRDAEAFKKDPFSSVAMGG